VTQGIPGLRPRSPVCEQEGWADAVALIQFAIPHQLTGWVLNELLDLRPDEMQRYEAFMAALRLTIAPFSNGGSGAQRDVHVFALILAMLVPVAKNEFPAEYMLSC
jgi:hypothetical protein